MVTTMKRNRLVWVATRMSTVTRRATMMRRRAEMMKKNKSTNQICNNTIHPSLHLILSSCLPSISMQRKDIINCVVLIMPFDHATNTIVIFLNYDFVYLNGKVLKYRFVAPKIVSFLAGNKNNLSIQQRNVMPALEFIIIVIFYFSSIFIYIFVNTSIR